MLPEELSPFRLSCSPDHVRAARAEVRAGLTEAEVAYPDGMPVPAGTQG